MKKLFVIVDAFLDRSQQTVQASHAVAAFCLQCPGYANEWANQNIVIKKVRDIESWKMSADVWFREPHYENRITAIAAYREEGFAEELPLI